MKARFPSRLLGAAAILPFSRPAAAHSGHWHLDEAALEKAFAVADGLYAWFAAHAFPIGAGLAAGLLAWLTVGLLQRPNRRP